VWVRVPPSAGTFFINLATARFASISFGSPGRNAVSAVGGAHNFLRRNKPIRFFQSTTGACSQNAGLHIKLHLAQRRNIRDQSIFVQTKSFKGMPSCFYRARPILCFCSFQGMLNASLRRAGASGVRNLTPSIDGSDGDLDSVGLSFATIPETSARIAVVAARDVRRKDRRVCINQFSTPSCPNEPAIETAKTQMERIGPLIAISKTKARALGCSEM